MAQGSLAERLRVLRARRGLTLTDASAQIGITRQTLRGLERGGQEPHYPTLRKIADGYGVPVEELLEEPVLLGKGSAPDTGQPHTEEPVDVPDTLEALLERCGTRTRYLAHPDLSALLSGLSPKEVRRVARDVREEKAAIAGFYARLYDHIQEHPDDFAAVLFQGKLAHAILGATLAIAARRDRALERIEPESSAKDREEDLLALQEAYKLVGARAG